MDVRQASARPKASNRPAHAERVPGLPENRLIWTNDNLVALQTLLDERHPKTREYRYRGKVDLIYIDPPFMVQGDFMAENSIDIDLDTDEDVGAKKDPSLVEILAYKDTWRQGLDTFLTMLRARLTLLRDFLAPSGSIYVHLDWHAVHYVKVMMDEIFGYDKFVNEIVWRRAFAHNDPTRCGNIHDTILVYSATSNRIWNDTHHAPSGEYIREFFDQYDEKRKERYSRLPLDAPRHGDGGNLLYEWKGAYPAQGRTWAITKDKMEEYDRDGRIHYPKKGMPRLKRYASEYQGNVLQDIWTDINKIHNRSSELTGYPTQKPLRLLERVIAASSPPGGLVLDCFLGSGTTAEAAERQGRQWIGIDNSKYAIHLTRKRLIHLSTQGRPESRAQYTYVECSTCNSIEVKEASPRIKEPFSTSPFTVENMGVYQRAESWQGFQTERSRYRDEMLSVFGAEVVQHSPLLHGKKGNAWVHVGPLDAAVTSAQVWSIAREAKRTDRKSVTILSADFDTLSGTEKEDVKAQTGVHVTIRIIPASAIDEVRRRLALQRSDPDGAIESMAVPAFYAPLAITLNATRPSKRLVKLTLERCEIDIESFLDSQRPLLKPVTDKMTPAAKKKAKAVIEKWEARRKDLDKWLRKATTWQKFIDFWAVDWDYGARVGADEKPIFETAWQSFRSRRSKPDEESLAFEAECQYPDAGHYRIAAKVTDVFGNDGLATVNVQVK